MNKISKRFFFDDFFFTLKQKKGSHLSNLSITISVSIQFTYSIYQNTFLDWNQPFIFNKRQQFSDELDNIELIESNSDDMYPEIKRLPFGSLQDCIE